LLDLDFLGLRSRFSDSCLFSVCCCFSVRTSKSAAVLFLARSVLQFQLPKSIFLFCVSSRASFFAKCRSPSPGFQSSVLVPLIFPAPVFGLFPVARACSRARVRPLASWLSHVSGSVLSRRGSPFFVLQHLSGFRCTAWSWILLRAFFPG
jgi:hypothetical protein